MRLRTARTSDGSVLIDRDDLVAALREQAPYSVEPKVRDAFDALATAIAGVGGDTGRRASPLIIPGGRHTPASQLPPELR